MISGIIAEYNPFHTGHKYLLEQAEGLKIVVMSGNFMQRGEPAIVDKLDTGSDGFGTRGRSCCRDALFGVGPVG